MKNADMLKNVKPWIKDVLIKYLWLVNIWPDLRGQTWAYILVTENLVSVCVCVCVCMCVCVCVIQEIAEGLKIEAWSSY